MSEAFRQDEAVTNGSILTPVPPRTDVSFRFIDLFAGLGGFHVALEQLGGRAVFAAEWEPQLNALYKTNFGVDAAGDINSVPSAEVPDHEVLTAGFPCQPFSKAGEQLGFKHTLQGQLFFKVAEIIGSKRPDYFILENVPNLLRHQGGETFKTILKTLRDLDYDVDAHRYSPHHFGVPQIRDRVYIVGSKDGLHRFVWPDPPAITTDIRSILDTQPSDSRPISPGSLRALEVWDDFLHAAPAGLKLPSFPIWTMEFGANYPYETETPSALLEELGSAGLDDSLGSFGVPLAGMLEAQQLAALPSHARRKQFRFPKWKVAFIRDNREFYQQNRYWIDPWMSRSNLQSMPSSLQKFEWNAQGERRSLWDFVIQLRASGVRVKRPTTAPSLVAMTDTQVPIIGWERRYMTPRECARLQSLASIVLPENRGAAYKALGNAVNSEVVLQIAGPLLSGLPRIASIDLARGKKQRLKAS